MLTQSKAPTTTASSSVLYWCGVGTLGWAAGESLVIVRTWDDGTDLMIFHLLFPTRGPRRGTEEIQTEIEVYHNPPEEGIHTVLKTNMEKEQQRTTWEKNINNQNHTSVCIIPVFPAQMHEDRLGQIFSLPLCVLLFGVMCVNISLYVKAHRKTHTMDLTLYSVQWEGK